MNALVLAAACALAAVGGEPVSPAQMPYETRAAAANASLPDVQFAILHALLGWKGGVNPPYAAYEARDRLFLGSLGVKVAAVEDATRRSLLDAELARIRRLHNFGVPGVDNGRRPITFEDVVARHRALILLHADRISYVAPDGMPVPRLTDADLWDRQLERVLAMKTALELMRRSATTEEFADGFDRFRLQAGPAFGARYERGVPRQPAYDACVKAFEAERRKAAELKARARL